MTWTWLLSADMGAVRSGVRGSLSSASLCINQLCFLQRAWRVGISSAQTWGADKLQGPAGQLSSISRGRGPGRWGGQKVRPGFLLRCAARRGPEPRVVWSISKDESRSAFAASSVTPGGTAVGIPEPPRHRGCSKKGTRLLTLHCPQTVSPGRVRGTPGPTNSEDPGKWAASASRLLLCASPEWCAKVQAQFVSLASPKAHALKARSPAFGLLGGGTTRK